MDSDPQLTAVRNRMPRVLLALLLAAFAWAFFASAWDDDVLFKYLFWIGELLNIETPIF